jgi:flagellar biosynthesis protein FliP
MAHGSVQLEMERRIRADLANRPRPRRRKLWLAAAALLFLATAGARGDSPAAGNAPLDLNNPISLLDNASRALPALGGSNTQATGGSIDPVGGGLASERDGAPSSGAKPSAPGGLSAGLSIIILLTVLTIAPALLILCTSFTRIVIVLSLLRQAIGTQSLPPSQVIVGLSLFLTLLVMAPTFDRINREAIGPMQENKINQLEAWERAKQPLRDFMFAQIDHAGNWEDLYMVLNYRGVDTSDPTKLKRADVDMIALIPAFVLSELKVAFLMGFRLYLPFLIIDMVISSVLISMGMLMLPPVLISLPFKLLLFVLVDGWRLVAGNLLHSFAVPGVG